MSNPHAHDEAFSAAPLGLAHAAGVAEAPFSDIDIAHLHAEDLYAARRVVTLMVGIFSVGVVLYTIVAWACAT